MSTLCSHCNTAAESSCSCGELICSESQASHFLRGHSSVPLLLRSANSKPEAAMADAPDQCPACNSHPCALFCTCVFPWSFFCRDCAEAHVRSDQRDRHGLEPIVALDMLRKKSEKRPYIERQLFFDEAAEMLKENARGVEDAKEEFGRKFAELISSLEVWKQECLQRFDTLGISEDANWALKRLESIRFQKEIAIEYGLDALLAHRRIEAVEASFTGVNFELYTEPLLRMLPACFRVENKLAALKLPRQEFEALKPVSVSLETVHNTNVESRFGDIISSLEATLRILSPSFESSRAQEQSSQETCSKETVAIAAALAEEVQKSFELTFQDIRGKMKEILKEMGIEEDLPGSNSSFPAYFERFKSVLSSAVSDMSGISLALKSVESVVQLTKARDDSLSEAAELRQQLQRRSQEIEQLQLSYESCLPYKQESDELRERNRSLNEELEKLRLSLSLGLGESLKGIMEHAKARIQRSEEAAIATLAASEQSVENWVFGLTSSLAREKGVIDVRWSTFTDATTLESVCDYIRKADDQTLQSMQFFFEGVKEAVAHNFRKLEIEVTAVVEKVAKDYSVVLDRYRKVTEIAWALPAFGMFKDALNMGVSECKDALTNAASNLQRITEDLTIDHTSILSLVEGIQTYRIKKKDRPTAYGEIKTHFETMMKHILLIGDIKDKLRHELNASIVSFEEASRDPNFDTLGELKDSMERADKELAQVVLELPRTNERHKTSLSQSVNNCLSLVTAAYENIPGSLQTHSSAFSSLCDLTLTPLVSAILQTRVQCESQIDSISVKMNQEQTKFKAQMATARNALEAEFKMSRKPFPDDVPVKPVVLAEAMSGLITSNEGLHEEVGLLTRGLSVATVTLQEKEIKLAAASFEKRVEMTLNATIGQWFGKASAISGPVGVNTQAALPDICFRISDIAPPAEPQEVLRSLILEAAHERRSTLLKQYLPDQFAAVPMTSAELWRVLDSRLLELATPGGDSLYSDIVVSEIPKQDIERLVAALSVLAARGQPKAVLWLRVLGLEENARAVPRDFGLVLKYMKHFKALADQYLRTTACQWKKAEMYQASRGGEALLDDVLTKFAHQFTGEIWYAFLKYCKPEAVTPLQFTLFLINWKLCTQNMRKEAPPLWNDASPPSLHSLTSTLLTYLDAWLPAELVQSALAEICPMGYLDRATLEACISRTAYLGMMNDERFVVRGDMFLLGVLEAHFTIQRINARKLAEAFESASIREGKFSKAAFSSALRLVAKEETALAELYEEAAKLEGSSVVGLEAFLRVMIRHKHTLFVHQLQVY